MTPEPQARATEAARIVEAVAAQRDLVAKHLHDEAVQSVSVAALRVELVRASLGPGEEVDELRDVLKTATTQIRAVMDSLRRPAVADGELARSLRTRLSPASAPLALSVVDDFVRDPPEHIGLVLHWVAEECVRALRRSGADGAISVALRSSADAYTLDVVAAGPADGSRTIDEAPVSAYRLAAMVGGTVTADASTVGVVRIAVRIPA